MKKIVGFVLVICLIVLFTQDIYLGGQKYKRWYDNGAGSLLPDPSDVLGREVYEDKRWSYNGSSGLDTDVYDLSQEEFEKYVDAVFECGFRLHFYREHDSFTAYHINFLRSREVSLYWWGNGRISIDIT